MRFTGSVGSVSAIGTSSGCPYTAQVDENTSRGTPAPRIASRRFSVPPTFVR